LTKLGKTLLKASMSLLFDDGDLGKTLSATPIETDAIDFREHLADSAIVLHQSSENGNCPSGREFNFGRQ
jgi:hypothetical protein